MRRIFHLESKSDGSHKYYGSLSALVEENTDEAIKILTSDDFKNDLRDFVTSNAFNFN